MKNFKKLSILCVFIILIVLFLFLKDVTINREIKYQNSTFNGETTLFDKMPNGNGEMIYSSGNKYIGNWMDGVRSGYGVLNFLNGSAYTGMWKNDEYNGEGNYTELNGYSEVGTFVDGNFESGLINDYYLTKDQEKLFFSRDVNNYVSEIINIDKVNDYSSLLNTFCDNITNEKLSFIFETEDYYDEFYSIYNQENTYYQLLDDIDDVLYDEYGFLGNSDIIYIIEYKEDETFVITVELRDVLNTNALIELDVKADEIINTVLTEDMNNFQKIKELHDYLVNNVTYMDGNENSHNAYGALIEGLAVCEGYTEAYSILLNKIAISNYMVSGDDLDLDDNSTHIWNLVEFDDSYYHIDVTWDDLDISYKKKYTYFGLSDNQILKTHIISRTNIPESGKINNMYYHYYSKNGLKNKCLL